MHTSKYGRSALTKSPMMSSSFFCCGLQGVSGGKRYGVISDDLPQAPSPIALISNRRGEADRRRLDGTARARFLHIPPHPPPHLIPLTPSPSPPRYASCTDANDSSSTAAASSPVRACHPSHATHVPNTRFCTSAAILGSISTATTFRVAGRIRTVRLPVPGPTSRTTSVGLRLAWEGRSVTRSSRIESLCDNHR